MYETEHTESPSRWRVVAMITAVLVVIALAVGTAATFYVQRNNARAEIESVRDELADRTETVEHQRGLLAEEREAVAKQREAVAELEEWVRDCQELVDASVGMWNLAMQVFEAEDAGLAGAITEGARAFIEDSRNRFNVLMHLC